MEAELNVKLVLDDSGANEILDRLETRIEELQTRIEQLEGRALAVPFYPAVPYQPWSPYPTHEWRPERQPFYVTCETVVNHGKH